MNTKNSLISVSAGTEFIKRVGEKIRKEIKGQENAVRQIEDALFRAFVLQKSKQKGPKMAMTFLGPSGVGKTELARVLANELGMNFLFVPLTSYSNKDSSLHMAGFDKSFKDSKEGVVTGAIMKNPNTVICFDELGSEHSVIDSLLLQLLNDGEIYDTYHQENISFKNTIVIFTTNLGTRSLYRDSNRYNYASLSHNRILEALVEENSDPDKNTNINSALISRLSKYPIVAFNKLDGRILSEISNMQKEKLVEENLLIKHPELTVKLKGSELAQILLFTKSGKADARSIGAETDAFIGENIHRTAEKLQARELDISLLKTINFDFNLKSLPHELICFSKNSLGRRVGVFCSDESFEIFSSSPCIKAERIEQERFNSLDYDCVIIEISPRDKFGAKSVFYVAAQENDLPIYVFSNDPDFDRIDAKEYISGGAIEVLLHDQKPISEWVEDISQSLALSNISSYLCRSNKALEYDIRYFFDVSNGQIDAHIQLVNYRLTYLTSAMAESNLLLGSNIPSTKFTDVIGLDGTVEEIKKTVDFFNHYRDNIRTGKKPPKGMLLQGPPGCGKTLLGRAMAGESNMAFIYISAAELSSPFYGVAEKAVKEKFETARQYAPSIIFIDEVDAIARPRGRGVEVKQEEKVLNMILTEMDGLNQDLKRPVYVMAATNINDLDPAFLRRVDRCVDVKLPNLKGRKELFKHYLTQSSVILSDDIVNYLAERTMGKSPADIAKLVEYTIRNSNSTKINIKIIDDTFELMEFGELREYSSESLKQTSYHEAGHAVIAWALGNTPQYITNISRGNHGGYVLPSEEDKATVSKQEILDKICMLFGGRAAEYMIYGENGITSGASSDIQQARNWAKHAVITYAMYNNILIGSEDIQSDYTKLLIDEKINDILKEQYQRACHIVKKYNKLIENLVSILLIKRSMTKKELNDFFIENNILSKKETKK